MNTMFTILKWLAMPIVFACVSIILSGSALPVRAFFHINYTLALVLYSLLLASWFMIYTSSGLDLYNNSSKRYKQQEVPFLFKFVGALSILLHGFYLMSGVAAFVHFCAAYGIFTMAFLSGNIMLLSGLIFIAGLIASYTLSYKRICEVGAAIKSGSVFKSRSQLGVTSAFIIALLVGISSAIFVYYMPLVLLSSIVVVPLHLVLVKAAVAFVAFVSTFSICFVPLKEQLDNLFTMQIADITFAKVVFFIISLIVAVVFCLVAYHQAALLFTITNGNRGFLIAEIFFQGLAFAAMCFDSYKVLTPIFTLSFWSMVFKNIIMTPVNVCFFLPLLLITIIAKYILPVFGLGRSVLNGIKRFAHSCIIPASISDNRKRMDTYCNVTPEECGKERHVKVENPSKLVFVLGGNGMTAAGVAGMYNTENSSGDCNVYCLNHMDVCDVSIDDIVQHYVSRLEYISRDKGITSIKLIGHSMGGGIFTAVFEKILDDERFSHITSFELCSDRTFSSLYKVTNHCGFYLVAPILTLLGWNISPDESIKNILANSSKYKEKNISIYINSAETDEVLGTGSLSHDAYSSSGNVKVFGKQLKEGGHNGRDESIGVFEGHIDFQEMNAVEESAELIFEDKSVSASDLTDKSKGNGGVLGFISQCLGISSLYQQGL